MRAVVAALAVSLTPAWAAESLEDVALELDAELAGGFHDDELRSHRAGKRTTRIGAYMGAGGLVVGGLGLPMFAVGLWTSPVVVAF